MNIFGRFFAFASGQDDERISRYAIAGALGRARLEATKHVADVGAFRVLERMRERERKHADSLRFLRGKRA